MAVMKQYQVKFVNVSAEARDVYHIPLAQRTKIIIVDGVTNMQDARLKALDMLYPEVKYMVGFQTKAQVAQDWRIVETKNVTRASSAQQQSAKAKAAKRKVKRAKRTVNGQAADTTTVKTVKRADIEEKLSKLDALANDPAATESERTQAAKTAANMRTKYAAILQNDIRVAA